MKVLVELVEKKDNYFQALHYIYYEQQQMFPRK